MLKIIEGSLLDAKETFICHQTNCVTTSAAGIAKSIFDKYPHSNVYEGREKASAPGTIIVSGGKDKRAVINMMAQYYPGPSMSIPASKSDDERFQYFRQCLGKMMKLKGDFAFPWRVGCGIANGNWDRYLGVLARFERVIKGNIVIYRLKNEKM